MIVEHIVNHREEEKGKAQKKNDGSLSFLTSCGNEDVNGIDAAKECDHMVNRYKASIKVRRRNKYDAHKDGKGRHECPEEFFPELPGEKGMKKQEEEGHAHKRSQISQSYPEEPTAGREDMGKKPLP